MPASDLCGYYIEETHTVYPAAVDDPYEQCEEPGSSSHEEQTETLRGEYKFVKLEDTAGLLEIPDDLPDDMDYIHETPLTQDEFDRIVHRMRGVTDCSVNLQQVAANMPDDLDEDTKGVKKYIPDLTELEACLREAAAVWNHAQADTF